MSHTLSRECLLLTLVWYVCLSFLILATVVARIATWFLIVHPVNMLTYVTDMCTITRGSGIVRPIKMVFPTLTCIVYSPRLSSVLCAWSIANSKFTNWSIVSLILFLLLCVFNISITWPNSGIYWFSLLHCYLIQLQLGAALCSYLHNTYTVCPNETKTEISTKCETKTILNFFSHNFNLYNHVLLVVHQECVKTTQANKCFTWAIVLASKMFLLSVINECNRWEPVRTELINDCIYNADFINLKINEHSTVMRTVSRSTKVTELVNKWSVYNCRQI